MDNLPYDIKLYIISYLPIISKNKKILLNIIKNYNSYFVVELLRLNVDVNTLFIEWSINNNIYEDILDITMFQIRNFYNYAIEFII
tara:strand:- start:862 stop:1119 length:258 start_codon:yes stop_codon:yes gene_type:complete